MKPVSFTHFDSTTTRLNRRIDSLQLRATRLLQADLSLNMLKQKGANKIRRTDSLEAVRVLDSIKGGLQHKIDSLSHLNLPTDRYKHQLDSLSKISPQKYVDQVQAKVKEIETRLNKPINDIESKVNEKLDLMKGQAGAGANLPESIKVDDLNLQGVDANLSLPGGEELKTSELSELNPLNKVENPLAEQMEQVGELREKIDDLKSIPQQQIDKIKGIDQVQAVQEKVGQANALIDKGQAYGEDLQRIAKGNVSDLKEIPQAIESKIVNQVSGLEGVSDLQKYTGEMGQYQQMIAKGNDPEALKTLAKQQAVKYARDHFAGKEQALQAAMSQMSKFKNKFPDLPSIKDVPRFVPNQMKGKALVERIVPGFSFQIQKAATFMIDLTPTVSYRLTGRYSLGVGWNERLSFKEWNQILVEDRIYGPRFFNTFELKKGFSLKAEVEKMNVLVPAFAGAAEQHRTWVWSVFAGIKKDYTFFKSVKGNVQILYNIYDDHGNSPYVDRLNVRMGWEVPMKRKVLYGE